MTYIIAEAGTNHAHPDPAERIRRVGDLVAAAYRSGTDAVKFQAFFSDEPLFCPHEGDEKRWPRWRESMIPPQTWEDIAWGAKKIGIDFLLSVFQPTGIELLKRLKPRYIKVASRAAKTFPYKELPDADFLISGGMIWDGRFSPPPSYILQCRMEYPTSLGRARLEEHHPDDGPYYSGLSDHSGAVWPGLDAIFRGAKFLEVHFNLGDFDAGPDKPVCLTTDQLKLLCEARDAAAQMR